MLNLLRVLRIRIQLFKLQLISKIRKRFFGNNVIGLLNDTVNGPLLVDPQDYVISKQLAEHGNYEDETQKILLDNLSSESRVCIVGAHIGTLLIPIARKVKSVFALEANPYTYNLLQLNLKINDIDNAQIFNYAAGDQEKMIDFYISRSNTGGSKIKPAKEYYEFTYDNPEVKKVKMVRLDDICADHNFQMVVMDIEGSEYFALQGMQDILKKCQYLKIEFIPNHLRKVACITNEQFLKAFCDYFDKAIIIDDGDTHTYKREEFLQMLEKIEREAYVYLGKDILLMKDE